MKPIRNFSEFVSEGVVKKQFPDKPRAEFLNKESAQAEAFLDKIVDKFGITPENANTIIKESYDILMSVIMARMLLRGYNSSGQGAHEAEVSYLREIGVTELDVQLADQLRYFRNGIMYYGKSMDFDYARKAMALMKKLKAALSE